MRIDKYRMYWGEMSTAAAISAGATMASAGASSGVSVRNSRIGRKLAHEQMAQQQKQFDAAMQYNENAARANRMWEEEMYKKYNSPEAMAQQYRNAGLNPYSLGGSAGSSFSPTAGTSMPTVDPSTAATVGTDPNLFYEQMNMRGQQASQIISSSFQQAAQILTTLVQAKNTIQDTQNKGAEYEGILANTNYTKEQQEMVKATLANLVKTGRLQDMDIERAEKELARLNRIIEDENTPVSDTHMNMLLGFGTDSPFYKMWVKEKGHKITYAEVSDLANNMKVAREIAHLHGFNSETVLGKCYLAMVDAQTDPSYQQTLRWLARNHDYSLRSKEEFEARMDKKLLELGINPNGTDAFTGVARFAATHDKEGKLNDAVDTLINKGTELVSRLLDGSADRHWYDGILDIFNSGGEETPDGGSVTTSNGSSKPSNVGDITRHKGPDGKTYFEYKGRKWLSYSQAIWLQYKDRVKDVQEGPEYINPNKYNKNTSGRNYK